MSSTSTTFWSFKAWPRWSITVDLHLHILFSYLGAVHQSNRRTTVPTRRYWPHIVALWITCGGANISGRETKIYKPLHMCIWLLPVYKQNRGSKPHNKQDIGIKCSSTYFLLECLISTDVNGCSDWKSKNFSMIIFFKLNQLAKTEEALMAQLFHATADWIGRGCPFIQGKLYIRIRRPVIKSQSFWLSS